ncbi:hypothetical protein [Streptacidiphilus monticola]|uniref:Uncharacterized protein n=1 Tax=Streptacidiphilus monticola TaxID=2161674 RepID=A0ABW1GA50_9ACTN
MLTLLATIARARIAGLRARLADEDTDRGALSIEMAILVGALVVVAAVIVGILIAKVTAKGNAIG